MAVAKSHKKCFITYVVFFSIQQQRAPGVMQMPPKTVMQTQKFIFFLRFYHRSKFFLSLPVFTYFFTSLSFWWLPNFCLKSFSFADIQLIWRQCRQLISLSCSISNLQIDLIVRPFAMLALELWHSMGTFLYQLATDALLTLIWISRPANLNSAFCLQGLFVVMKPF